MSFISIQFRVLQISLTFRYALDAGLSFICWEILVTLDDEVALMWP
jgi:hypothetical protein